jgi:tight adherence protein B
MIFAIATFALVGGIVLGVYWLFLLKPEEGDRETVRQRLKGALIRRQDKLVLLKEEQKLSTLQFLDTNLRRVQHLLDPLQRTIDESGVRMTPGLLLVMSAALALATYFVMLVFFPWRWPALLLALLVSTGPYLYVKFKRSRRLLKFEEQFPEAIDLIARALRAGHAFTTGLGMVSEEIPPPVGLEFKLLFERQNFGLPLPEAMREFAKRVPILDARFFVTAVLTQREAGGNLSEVLDNLSSVVRERFKVKRQVRVISAHGRITGWILTAMPPLVALGMMFVVPDSMRLLATDPLGIRLVIAGIVLQVTGALVIRKILSVEY